MSLFDAVQKALPQQFGGTLSKVFGETLHAALEGTGGFSGQFSRMMEQFRTSLNATSGGSPAQPGTGVLGGPLGGLGGTLPPGAIQKLFYISVLNGAIKKATQSQHFNLETHINDLWVSLSLLRNSPQQMQTLEATLSQQQQQVNQITQELNALFHNFQTMATTAAKNMR